MTQFGVSLFPRTVLRLKGHNGSGKTTLLRTIAGLIPSRTGHISWNNVNIYDEFSTYCSLLEYVGHKPALKEELTVRENITFWASMGSTPELVEAAIAYFQLSSYAETPCGKLSAGWQKRVSLARLIACNARLWLLDEPDVHLDEEGKTLLWNLISSRSSEGGIVIMASHGDKEYPFHIITVDVEDFKLMD